MISSVTEGTEKIDHSETLLIIREFKSMSQKILSKRYSFKISEVQEQKKRPVT